MSHPIFARASSPSEQKTLVQFMRSSGDARIARRAQMVRLSQDGKTASEIAALWQVSSQTVRRVIQGFNTEGIDSLMDRPRTGRPSKVTDEYVALLKEAVQSNPRDMGYPFTAWTLERLREHLGRHTGIVFSPAHLSRLLADHDIVYRRPKHGMGHLRDPQEYSEKKAFLEFVKKTRRSPMPASNCSTLMNVRFTSTQP